MSTAHAVPVHVPASEPGGTEQLSPVWQSLLVVHDPPQPCGIVPHFKLPFASGTQGSPLQQSPLNEQVPPAGTHVVSALQRGMPVLSGTQHDLVLMHAQQSARKLVLLPP